MVHDETGDTDRTKLIAKAMIVRCESKLIELAKAREACAAVDWLIKRAIEVGESGGLEDRPEHKC